MSHDADCERWRKVFSILSPDTDQGDISPCKYDGRWL
jgi:hypothetical protein